MSLLEDELQVLINHKGEIGLHFKKTDQVFRFEASEAEKIGLLLLKASKSKLCPAPELWP